jgi:hypothetical protein
MMYQTEDDASALEKRLEGNGDRPRDNYAKNIDTSKFNYDDRLRDMNAENIDTIRAKSLETQNATAELAQAEGAEEEDDRPRDIDAKNIYTIKYDYDERPRYENAKNIVR